MSFSTIFFLYFCLFILLLSPLLLITINIYSLSYTGGYIHIMLKLLLLCIKDTLLVAFASSNYDKKKRFVEGAAETTKMKYIFLYTTNMCVLYVYILSIYVVVITNYNTSEL